MNERCCANSNPDEQVRGISELVVPGAAKEKRATSIKAQREGSSFSVPRLLVDSATELGSVVWNGFGMGSRSLKQSCLN